MRHDLDFVRVAYGVGGAIALLVLSLLALNLVILRPGCAKEKINANGTVTFRVSKIKIACMHIVLWIGAGWVIGMIYFFESTKTSPKDAFAKWGWFLLAIFCFFFVIDLLMHWCLIKSYISISKEQISFTLDFKKHCLQFNQIEAIIDKNEKYLLVTKDGKSVSITYMTLDLMGCSEQLHKFFREEILNRLQRTTNGRE